MKKHYENGVHDITNQSYHSSAGISRSMLMDFKRSPHHYWYNHVSGAAQKEEPTPAMNLGNAVHTLVLEPGMWNEDFFVIKQLTRPRKDTAPWQKILDEADGRIILTPDESVKASCMANSVLTHPYAQELLQDCKVEQSIYFQHKGTGLQCKARPDAWFNNVVIDLKTNADGSYKAFQAACMNYGYFIQSAVIKQALESVGNELDEFIFIGVEKEPPYCVSIYNLSQEGLEYGEKMFNDLMLGIAHCINSNNWPGYAVKEILPPKWAAYDDELEID